ncbi:DNA gyrase inhibitor YacG [Jiella sp. MQZ9-1]|uniref:DNA gyrase inhibitor YacG n=1 Tax=Jiella flava TaxID=2816857 RepID=A0A939JYG0_9HYPH|nr:DNA gyrase inhibitor YacG [Jiella flava]MBO0664371.1 DNA gyrase inhibitor YacG [Jiella flava]MCD2473006.1 DNA gyrase inhibitor YacG [Jiella flava]
MSAGPAGAPTPMRPTRKCPECGKPSRRETFPFCSPRCKAVDLNRWLSGHYVIPGSSIEDAGDESGEA